MPCCKDVHGDRRSRDAGVSLDDDRVRCGAVLCGEGFGGAPNASARGCLAEPARELNAAVVLCFHLTSSIQYLSTAQYKTKVVIHMRMGAS
jgi:hypothetical protein